VKTANRSVPWVLCVLCVPLPVFATPLAAAEDAPEGRVPVIYCTDLFHPHDDPDDHFDIAVLYAIGEISIEAIILDQGAKQEKRPGRIPVEQLNHITGRNVPWAIGLSGKLEQPGDKRLDEPERFQSGVRRMIKTLEKAQEPVTIITVGSVRDLAVAFNRRPALLNEKVARVYAFIGDAQGAFEEYNVGIDPNAYACVMNSGLPVYWVPCFDGGLWHNDGHASFWKAPHAELLADASKPVINFFTYGLLRKTDADYIGFLRGDVTEADRGEVMASTRNLWCTAVFTHVSGMRFVSREGHWRAVAKDDVRDSDTVAEVFRFAPVSMCIDAEGNVRYGPDPQAHTILRFEVPDTEFYADVMTSATRQLIGELGREALSEDDVE
jgi:Inosine-uridine preferring nucleoside hydrolase